MEIWKDIPGYEGLYKVSNLGRVKNLKENTYIGCDNGKGYMIATIRNSDNERKNVKIHKIVAEIFIPYTGLNPDGTPINGRIEVNHKDKNKTNNAVDNLEWCDSKYNNRYCNRLADVSKKLSGKGNPMYNKKGSLNHKSKRVKCIETGKVYDCCRIAAEEIEISSSMIARAANKNSVVKSAGGYHWEYV